MNSDYINKIFQVNNEVTNRLKNIINLIDFSKIHTIFDIGSWHLNQSIEFGCVFENASIHAFEPTPTSYQQCVYRKNQTQYSIANRITIHELALSDKNDYVDFYPLDSNRTNSSNQGIASLLPLQEGKSGQWHNDYWPQKKISVKSETLDNFCLTRKINPYLIWCDVQGAELLLFQGGKNTLKNHVKIIMTEVGINPYYSGHTLKPEIDKLLTEELGFIEVKSAFFMQCQYEGNAIYINPNIL